MSAVTANHVLCMHALTLVEVENPLVEVGLLCKHRHMMHAMEATSQCSSRWQGAAAAAASAAAA